MLFYQLLGSSSVKSPSFHGFFFVSCFPVFIIKDSFHQQKFDVQPLPHALLCNFLFIFCPWLSLFPCNTVFKSCSGNVFVIVHMLFRNFNFKLARWWSSLFQCLCLHDSIKMKENYRNAFEIMMFIKNIINRIATN